MVILTSMFMNIWSRSRILTLACVLVVGCSSSPTSVPELTGHSTPATSQGGYELRRTLPYPRSADELMLLVEAWFKATTWSRPTLIRKDEAANTLVGRDTVTLKYEAGDLKGTATLTYDLLIETRDSSYTVTVSGARINGRPAVNETCWVPCNTAPLPSDREVRIARIKEEAMWSQLNTGARRHMENIAGMIHLGISHPTKPGAVTGH